MNRAMVEKARLAGMQAAVQGQNLGDLFKYASTAAVTIRKNQSALVPIVRADSVSSGCRIERARGRPACAADLC